MTFLCCVGKVCGVLGASSHDWDGAYCCELIPCGWLSSQHWPLTGAAEPAPCLVHLVALLTAVPQRLLMPTLGKGINVPFPGETPAASLSVPAQVRIVLLTSV